MSRSRYVDPHAVVKCATGKLVVRSNEERDFAPGLPSRDGPTSLVTSQGHRRCSRCPCAMNGSRAVPLLGVDRAASIRDVDQSRRERNSRRGLPLASSFADEEREMGARHHAPGSRRARVLGAQWIPQLRRPMAGTAVLGRLKWHVCRVLALRDDTATARTIALQVPDWPGHVAAQRVDIHVTAAGGSCLRPPCRADRAFWTHGRSAPALSSCEEPTALIRHSPGYRVAASASHCQSHEFSQPQPPTQPTGSGAGCAAKNRERHVRAMLA